LQLLLKAADQALQLTPFLHSQLQLLGDRRQLLLVLLLQLLQLLHVHTWHRPNAL
jgi:hypothetical protein